MGLINSSPSRVVYLKFVLPLNCVPSKFNGFENSVYLKFDNAEKTEFSNDTPFGNLVYLKLASHKGCFFRESGIFKVCLMSKY